MARSLSISALMLLAGLGLWAALACPGKSQPTAESLARQAATLHHEQKFAQAIELYRESLELHPDPAVRANLARALAAAGEYAKSAEQYQLLLKDDPSNGALWHDYGIVLKVGTKDLGAAEEALFNATKYPPKSPEASYDLGCVLMQLERYEDAGACFEAAIAFASPKASWLEDARDQQVKAYLFAKQNSKPSPR